MRLSPIFLGLMLTLPSTAGAQPVCRSGNLGTATCTGTAPRPLPRPPWDIVRSPEKLNDTETKNAQEIIPARSVNSLGGVLVDPPGGVGNGYCRAGTLGNLRCR